MKGIIKAIKGYFPVTVTDAVYFKNTNMTLQQAIDAGEFSSGSGTGGGSVTIDINYDELRSFLNDKTDLLINYKGEFLHANYATSTFRGKATKGDWWIYKGVNELSIDGNILSPNGIVYFDEGFFMTIYVPYRNNVNKKPNYDVCIVGCGAGGIGAAYALRNSGFRVCIVERLDTLGGTHCQGVGLYLPSPLCPWFKEITEPMYNKGGIIGFQKDSAQGVLVKVGEGSDFDQLYRASQYTDWKNVINGFRGNYVTNNDARLTQEYFNDFKSSIDIFINTELLKTYSDNGTVYSIDVRNVLTGQEFQISADYFIDCTGDGALYTSDDKLKLDVDYFIGTDDATRFNEIGAGMYSSSFKGDHYAINTVEPAYYSAGKLYHAGFSLRTRVPVKKFADVTGYKLNYSYSPIGTSAVSTISNTYSAKMSTKDFILKSNEWNMGNGSDRAAYMESISPYTISSRFGGIRKMLAIREKYRVYAEKTVDCSYLDKQITSQNYIEERTIALSTWWVDIHNQSYFVKSNIANGVPYESMIPKAYKNVLVACRGFGASHIAASSIRLVRTMMDLGHSAGTAILQLLKEDNRVDVRNVNVAKVQEDIRILETIEELEEYFYGPTVTYTTV